MVGDPQRAEFLGGRRLEEWKEEKVTEKTPSPPLPRLVRLESNPPLIKSTLNDECGFNVWLRIRNKREKSLPPN